MKKVATANSWRYSVDGEKRAVESVGDSDRHGIDA